MKIPLEPFWGTNHPVYAALDLSTKLDLTAGWFALPYQEKIYVGGRAWIPRESIERREKVNRDRFFKWEEAGWLGVIPGAVIDYKIITRDIKEIAKQLKVVEIAGDPWHLEFFAQQLEEEEFNILEFKQSMKTMSPATKIFEALVYSKTLVHDNNPILRWALGNCKIETDGNANQRPTKKKSTGKIDPLIACIMASVRAEIAMNDGGEKSIYETQGLTLL